MKASTARTEREIDMIRNRSTTGFRGLRLPLGLLVTLFLTLLAACSQAPAPDAEAELAPAFGTSSYDTATGLAKHDIGVFVVGETSGNLDGTNKGNTDAFIRMYARSGSLIWGRQFGTASRDRAEDVASPSNSDVYVVGATGGNLAVPGSSGDYDAFIRKYTSGGYMLWTRQFGSSGRDWAYGVAASGSHIYVVGFTSGNLSGTNKGGTDAFIRKYNADGSIAWTRQFGTSAEDYAYDVAVNSTGYAYVVGYTRGSLSGTNGGGADMFIRKYSPTGGVIWTRQWHYNRDDFGTAVAVSGRNVYLVGHSASLNTSQDNAVHVVKYTSWGSLVWSRTTRDHRSINRASDASADASGNLYVSGTTRSLDFVSDSDGYVRKLNASGSTLWKRRINLNQYDDANAVLAHPSSEVYVAGSTSARNTDAYLRRLSGSTGSTTWTR